MRTLLLDVETAPLTVYCWGLREQDISLDQVIDTSYVMCWSAKWLGTDHMMFERTWIRGASGKAMIKHIHSLLNEADAVITYNGLKFDVPVLNREFIVHDLAPPSPCEHIDLIKTARSQFRFASNKLDHLAKELGLGSKAPHDGFMTWIRCMDLEPEAWECMTSYNKHDVVILERLYHRLLPWIKPTHCAIKDGSLACPRCESRQYQSRGKAFTKTRVYTRYQCKACHGWFRSVASDKTQSARMVAI